MVNRGLLYREWMQHRVVFCLVSLCLVLIIPFAIYNIHSNYHSCLLHSDPRDCEFIVDYSQGSLFSYSWGSGVVLAVCLLGLERTKGMMDHLMSMPYTRSQVYNTKFWLGGAFVVVPQTAGFGLATLMLHLYKPDKIYYFNHFIIGAIIISFMAYALVMAAGTMTGNIFAQLLTAFTVAILPFLIIGLPVGHLEVIFNIKIGDAFSFFEEYYASRYFIYFTPITYVFPDWVKERKLLLLIPAAMSILFYIIGYFSFINGSVERNGHFFLSEKLNRPIQIVVIIIAVLGFGLFGYSASNSIIGYIFGLVFGALIGFCISYLLIYKKVKRM
ncbi:ABC transporter permease [Bacillus sp. YC2]|uniref:ABC transporter permease n=1 Tax=Bacillus sp. YC2 TaxID=2861287 RepID=UPI001CA5FAE8|nr:ABC transporter permease [Bacillus sp. YC2]MBY8913070.1 ABC transporter permease [Bacillus sp. YC2]